MTSLQQKDQREICTTLSYMHVAYVATVGSACWVTMSSSVSAVQRSRRLLGREDGKATEIAPWLCQSGWIICGSTWAGGQMAGDSGWAFLPFGLWHLDAGYRTARNLFWQIGDFKSISPIFHLSNFYVMMSSLHIVICDVINTWSTVIQNVRIKASNFKRMEWK